MVNETLETIIAQKFGQDAVNAFSVGALGILIGLAITAVIILLLAFYVYTSLAWYTIGRKLKYKHSWLAWIPIARWAMILHIGNFHWAWIFLILIPILGWIALFVLLIIATWRIYEKRKYPGWFSLALILPNLGGVLYLIVIGFVAWKDLKRKLIDNW